MFAVLPACAQPRRSPTRRPACRRHRRTAQGEQAARSGSGSSAARRRLSPVGAQRSGGSAGALPPGAHACAAQQRAGDAKVTVVGAGRVVAAGWLWRCAVAEARRARSAPFAAARNGINVQQPGDVNRVLLSRDGVTG